MNRAFRIARRYAEGGSDDEPPLLGWGVNPVKSLVEHRPVLQMDPLTGPRSGAAPTPTEPIPAPPAQSRQDLARDVAGELVNQYGDNHQAISERMLRLDPQDHNDVMGHLPQSVQNGIIDHRLQEANRLLNPPAEPTTPAEPRQPGASRTGYVSPYGIYGQHAEPSDDIPTSEEEYSGQLSPFEGETYRGVPREQHPFRDMSQDALDGYQKYIQPTLGKISDFAKKFFGGYDTRGISVESGFHPEYGNGSLSFDGALADKGTHVAHTSVSFNPATNSAHLGLLEIDPQYRGVAGPKLLRSQIDAYKALKLNFVDLYAAGGGDPYGGSYAWAKYGFVPNQQDWDLMRNRFMARMNRTDLAPGDPEAQAIVRNILSNRDPRSIWRLSDVTAPTVYGKPAGKQMLLSTGWSGQLTFRDPGAMRRFDAYISRPKKPKAD